MTYLQRLEEHWKQFGCDGFIEAREQFHYRYLFPEWRKWRNIIEMEDLEEILAEKECKRLKLEQVKFLEKKN
jgi:hypothetical protein